MPKYKRLTPNGPECRLKGAYLVQCTGCVKDADGNVTEVLCTCLLYTSTMLENNEDLAFVIPEEGSNWFVDAMCVLKSSQHKAEAYEWINFIASTDSNLANMDYIWYASPNAEALAEYPAYYEEQYGEPLDEEIYNIMAIPDEERERCEIYVNLPQETLKFYDKLWTQLGV